MQIQGPDDLQATPRFCPRCRRGRGGDGRLCAECGEALVDQGYCGICEGHWPIEAGEPCPKHELPLEAGPPDEDEAQRPAPGAGWVTVGRYANPIEAEARRLRLEAEGIPTFLDGARMGLNSLYAVATGGIKLQVPRPMADDARVLLAQSWAPPRTPDDELDEAWDELEPEPASTRVVLTIWKVGLGVIAAGVLLVLVLIALDLGSG